MANETEKVEYVFEGDTSSLKNATQEALGLLSKYSNSMKEASNLDAFKASQRSVTSINASINRVTKDIEKMQAKLKNIDDVKIPRGTDASKAIGDTIQTVYGQMQKLGSIDTITTKTLTAQRVELERVRNTLKDTSPQIDRLIAGEQKFQNILESTRVKAEQFSNTLYSAKDKMSMVFEPITNKAVQFSNTMNNVRGKISSTFEPVINKVKSFADIFTPIISKIQAFKDKAAIAFSRVGTLASTCASAFRRVSSAEDSADSSANKSNKSHNSLGNTLRNLTNRFKKNTEAIRDEAIELDSLDNNIKKSKSSYSSFTGILANLGNKFKSGARSSKTFATNLRGVSNASHLISGAIQVLSGITISDWLAQGTKHAIEYTENLNLFTVAMGNSVNAGFEFVDSMQEIYGMDPSNLYRYSGYFYQLTDAIGMTDKASSSLSLSLTKASNDIASLFNVPIEDVVEDLASGMQGMSRAVRKYGMDIRATTLEQTALKYGLTAQVETMSESNRMALRYITMMEQVKNATQQVTKSIDGSENVIGDFANTIETPANQLRIFKEQITQLGRAIGNFIVAPLSRAMAYINGFVMALRVAINFIGSLFGKISEVPDTSGATDSLDNIGAAADSAAKKVKGVLAPFDELNVLQDKKGSGKNDSGISNDILDPALEQAISDMSLSLDNIRMKANKVRDSILEFFGFKIDAGKIISWDSSEFEKNLINKFPQWTKTIQATFDNWSDIVNGFKKVFKSMWGVIKKTKDKVLDFFKIFINDDTVSTFIEKLPKRLDKLSDWISKNEDPIANFSIAVVGIGTAFKVLKPILSIISGLFDTFGISLGGVITPLLTFVGIAAAVAGVIYLLYKHSESFATSFKNLLDALWTGLQPVGDAITHLFETIWTDMQGLWDDHIAPMIESTGDALAPVLDTIGSLWGNVSEILTNVVNRIEDSWTKTIKPILELASDMINDLMDLIEKLWKEVLGPVIEDVGNGLEDLWNDYIDPIISDIIDITSALIDIIDVLWNEWLKPFLDWFIDSFGPQLKGALTGVWQVIKGIFAYLGARFKAIFDILKGLVEFIAGVFTGDWKRALSGLLNIFVGLGNGILGVIKAIINILIGLLNVIINLVSMFFEGELNKILDKINDVTSVFGIEIPFRFDFKIPTIPEFNPGWSIPEVHLATGGVVTSPTSALIGEGRYDEAVIPLGNSPQMRDLVSDIADAMKDNPTGTPTPSAPIHVHVYIGDDEVAEHVYTQEQLRSLQTNGGR